MYIDCKNYDEFNQKMNKELDGRFVSPGYICDNFDVSRQLVQNWIVRDNLINAYRYEGDQGYFICIPLTEVEKIYELRIKKLLKKREEEASKK